MPILFEHYAAAILNISQKIRVQFPPLSKHNWNLNLHMILTKNLAKNTLPWMSIILFLKINKTINFRNVTLQCKLCYSSKSSQIFIYVIIIITGVHTKNSRVPWNWFHMSGINSYDFIYCTLFDKLNLLQNIHRLIKIQKAISCNRYHEKMQVF